MVPNDITHSHMAASNDKAFTSSLLGIYKSHNILEPRLSRFDISGHVQFSVKIKLELLGLMEYFQESTFKKALVIHLALLQALHRG